MLLPANLNHTLLFSSLKGHALIIYFDFRGISLDNVIYKLVTKVICNQSNPVLPSIISNTQGAFTQGKFITVDIIIAFDVFHALQGDSSTNGGVASKLDIVKVFDRVGRPFLSNIMLHVGFRSQCVELIMMYIK